MAVIIAKRAEKSTNTGPLFRLWALGFGHAEAVLDSFLSELARTVYVAGPAH